MLAAALLMAATGLGFAGVDGFWPLLLIAFVGTLNPSGGDVSVFLPLEHTVLAHVVADEERTAVFARYSFVGAFFGALGALVGAVDWFAPDHFAGDDATISFRTVRRARAAHVLLYRDLSPKAEAGTDSPPAPLGPSRRGSTGWQPCFRSMPSAGGSSSTPCWRSGSSERFGLSVATIGAIFFVTSLCSAVSYFSAVPLAQRFGLVNTMVFTHLPSNLFLILTAFAPTIWIAFGLLIVRGLLSQMDVPTRSSYVMAVVSPEERPAAASVTAVPRSLASALAPLLSGWLLTVSLFGWPLVLAGALKAAYDLALLWQFSKVKPPEEVAATPASRRGDRGGFGAGLQPRRVITRLGQQPVAECGDLGKGRRRLRAHDPVGLGQRQRDGEGPHQTPVNQVPGRQGRAGKGDPLTVNGGVDEHAGTVQHGPVHRAGVANAGRLKPPRPTLPVLHVQQRVLQDVGGHAHGARS